jgi:hypothetical protein
MIDNSIILDRMAAEIDAQHRIIGLLIETVARSMPDPFEWIKGVKTTVLLEVTELARTATPAEQPVMDGLHFALAGLLRLKDETPEPDPFGEPVGGSAELR